MSKVVKTMPIGRSGISASVVGLGTFAIGGWNWGGTDRKKAIRAIEASIDAGVTLIDTAPIYGFGLAESIVGEAIRGKRDKVVIATKCGLRWDTEEGQFDGYADEKSATPNKAKYRIHRYLAPESINYEVERSLRRLGTDYIDLYQTHWQEETTPIEATMDALVRLRDQGKIRSIGVSNINLEQLERYGNEVASVQEKFSLVDDTIVENGIVDYCATNGLALLTYFTLEQGLLTGRMSPHRHFNEGDTRRAKVQFKAERIQLVNEALAELEPFAEKYAATIAQIVISLTLSRRGITHALVGARDPKHAEENAGGGSLDLEQEDLDAMMAIVGRLDVAQVGN